MRISNRTTTFAVHAAIILLAFLSVASCTPRQKNDTPPNLILLSIDTLRADHMSAYGYERPTTPNIDKFFAEGTRFDKAISSAFGTPPAMASLLTGRAPYWGTGLGDRNTNKYGMGRFIPKELSGDFGMFFPKVHTIAEHLRTRGYLTVGYVTNPYLTRTTGMNYGCVLFEDYYKNYNPYPPADQVIPDVIEFLENDLEGYLESSGKKSFYLWVHLMEPHFPYEAQQQFKVFSEKYTPTIPLKELDSIWENGEVNETFRENNELMMARYDECILMMDHYVGMLLDALEKLGRMDNTIVVLVADHGEEFLEHGLTTHKNHHYVELVRVPLLIKLPGKGKTPDSVDQIVRMYDIMPTLLDFMALDKPADLDGTSFLDLIRGNVTEPRTAFSEFFGKKTVRTEGWKYFRTHKEVGSDEYTEALFDLKNDPGETRNVVVDHPALAKELNGKMEAFRTMTLKRTKTVNIMDKGKPKTNPDLQEKLKTLGYLN